MFRITQRSMADSTYANLQASLARSSNLQEQLSSGKQISKPSDSPSGTSDVLQLKGQRAANAQYVRNADNGIAWLDTADDALQLASSRIIRAREITVAGANGAMSATSRNALAEELQGVRDSLVELSNTQYLGRPVFGGTTAGAVAFDPVTGAYVGDGGAVQRRVGAESSVQVNVDGVTAFGDGPTGIVARLDAVIADLRANTSTQSHVAGIDASHQQLLGAAADVGARTNRIESLQAKAVDSETTLRSAQSQIEDVDLPKTILELQLQSVAYQAALGATARVLQPTLLDFLR